MTRTDTINRLAAALTYYREHRPDDPRRLHSHTQNTARRYGIRLSVMRDAVAIMSGVDVTTAREEGRA